MKFVYMAMAFLIIITACSRKSAITRRGDYDVFLTSGTADSRAREIKTQAAFWESRLEKDTGNHVDMLQLAICHLKIFGLKGAVEELKLADSLLIKSSARLNDSDPDLLFALSQSRVSQHRFREAAGYVDMAGNVGADPYTKKMLQFDTDLELGAMFSASEALHSLEDQNSFDYLIRRAKIEDRNGHAGIAIQLMEQAFSKVKNGNTEMFCWALSNLADMYGHAGRIGEAYQSYLDVLRRDKSYLHALKGIAWIAYSHDRNADEAIRIYQYILSEKRSPDVLLILAEIEEWLGNQKRRDGYIQQFMSEIKSSAYGDMYNTYLLDIYNKSNEYRLALQIAEKEVAERPTPETYDWLAWCYFKNDEAGKAYDIVNNFVYRRNYEPIALWHMATIFAAVGKPGKAKVLFEECLKSSFELGPVKTKQVTDQLNDL